MADFKLSVIIPTYRPQNYLFECLTSVINQEIIDTKDYEILIVLNGPCNPYKENINFFLSERENSLNIRLIYTREVGVSNARNIGIKESTGDFICFIDDDDLISKSYLWNLLSRAKENEIVAANVLTFTDSITSTGSDYLGRAYCKCCKKKSYNIFVFRSFLSTSCAKIIPKKMIADRRFNNKYELSEDSLFMFSISDHLKKITLTSADCVYYRRVRANSVSRTTRKRYKRVINSLNLAYSYTLIYLKGFYKYNFFFYVSRLVGLGISIIKNS
ncbi:glycosyltransferase [Bacteroides fragilis]|uniref:glycosyltransferase family 2 protein n=1 Tax=Bacteroides hominis TaxID=2763023 RepID=UPI00294036F4|nr:glycosyltransferase [Bacteroides fragilis]